MPEQDFTVVEKTDSDNGYDSLYKALHGGEKEAASVKELVDAVLADLKPGDCIKSLTIVGHGAPGTISVGNGQSGTDPTKEIDGNNENVWGPELDRLRCRFCKDGYVYLRGCNVGAEQAGIDKLEKIARHLVCAIVQAPTGVCNPIWTTGEDQTFTPGKPKPGPLANPDTKKKKKKGAGERVPVVAGTSPEELIQFEPKAITAGRYLPRVLGRRFDLEWLSELGVEVPAPVLQQLVRGLSAAVPQWLPKSAFSMTGYLQLEVKRGNERTWVPPGALLGGGAYYSALREDTSVAYAFPTPVARQLARFHVRVAEELG
jgi:Domain of unknown function (DUF4347)